MESPHLLSAASKHHASKPNGWPPPENFKPVIVGGHDLTSMRAQFDQDSKNIIVASNRQLFYYNVETSLQAGKANLISSNLSTNDKVAALERLESSLYVITNHGLIFIWSLETRDWINELSLPLNEGETLVSCKMLSKRQYIYSILDAETKKTTLFFSMSRSERERPKQREAIGECTLGEQQTFDIGAFFDMADIADESKAKRDKLTKQHCLTYIQGPYVYFQRVAISEKFSVECHKQRIKDYDFTCVRASTNRFLIAAGDALGRIYLFTGDFAQNKFNRTKLHWHTMPVNDLCFSSTGNTLFSVGGESGCVAMWDISENNIGKKQIIPRLGMPIRYVNCSSSLNQLVLSFEDNEIQTMDTNYKTKHLKTLTRRTINMYKENNYKALRVNGNLDHKLKDGSVGLLWHSITNTVVTNSKTGWLQFYSPAERSRLQALNFLKSNALSLEKEAKVIPSDITKATLTLDGNWLAFYETRESESSFPEVKLHIWQRSSSSNRWVWIQTADRLHSSTSIVDLKFSPDGQFLVSVSDDGVFHVLHRINLEPKVGTSKTCKEMYAKGFVGNVPERLPAMATFSQDSSVLAISLKNDTTLIWMIVDPFKLVYECQLCQIDSQSENPSSGTEVHTTNSQPSHDVLGLHFGYHKPSQSLAPLCEVRSDSIRIWNILNSEESMEYQEKHAPQDDTGENVEFTAAAFDQCPGDGRSLNHFAVCTRTNHVLIFKLQIFQTTKTLSPLIVVNCTLPYVDSSAPLYYSHMCFLGNPILEIDKNCHGDPQLVKLLNRLCLMNSYQELVSITDKLTLERESACNSCNEIKTFDMSALQAYFAKNVADYREETKELPITERLDSNTITEKQRRIKKRLEVKKMLKDVLIRIPSQNLPSMDTLGPMILDKLI